MEYQHVVLRAVYLQRYLGRSLLHQPSLARITCWYDQLITLIYLPPVVYLWQRINSLEILFPEDLKFVIDLLFLYQGINYTRISACVPMYFARRSTSYYVSTSARNFHGLGHYRCTMYSRHCVTVVLRHSRCDHGFGCLRIGRSLYHFLRETNGEHSSRPRIIT